jgi:Fe-S-cluster-containing dehydrogenase component/DMSO reductase anchor subunit
VDLDACTGCKSCVAACHSLNGLDAGETWRSVGLLLGDGPTPTLQHVTTACHHCLDPACLTGCPVDAYEKDPITGIVRHLDDQCIGCRYCTLTCPYEVPRYHADLGIVRKCDLCADRLGAGEAPACAQACPTDAIAVTTVRVDEVRRAADAVGAVLVPTAPDSSLTRPTTTYRSTRTLAETLRAADEGTVVPAHSHPPLVAMLVLTQVAVGVAATMAVLRLVDPAFADPALATTSAGVVASTGAVAMAASILHLGRPRHAWRAVRGVGHSWLSREIVAFGAFGGLAAALALARAVGMGPASLTGGIGDATVAMAGLAGVAASAAVYGATRRRWWALTRTLARFLLTTTSTGTSVAALLVILLVSIDAVAAAPGVHALVGLLVVALAVLFLTVALERWWQREGPGRSPELARSAALLHGPLRPLVNARVSLVAVAVGLRLIALAIAATEGVDAPGLVVVVALAIAFLLTSEVIARHVWFLAVSSARMPGTAP